MSTCVRCGAADCGAHGEPTACKETACLKRQLANQHALLRSVTRRLENASEKLQYYVDYEGPGSSAELAKRDVDAVLEALS
jgi:hypothetical protein